MAGGRPFIVGGARSDLKFRLPGVMLLLVAYGACRWLLHLRGAHGVLAPGPLPYLLCAVTFLCTGVGSVLVLLGGGVRQPVRVSERWMDVAKDDPGASVR